MNNVPQIDGKSKMEVKHEAERALMGMMADVYKAAKKYFPELERLSVFVSEKPMAGIDNGLYIGVTSYDGRIDASMTGGMLRHYGEEMTLEAEEKYEAVADRG